MADPIDLLLSIPQITNKLQYFKLLKFEKLHLRITITSTNFNYGLASLCFWPFDKATWAPKTYSVSEFFPLTYACTLPHVYVTPTDVMGGELVVPWFYPTTAIDISTEGTRSSYIGTSTPFFRVFSGLRSVGAITATPANYTVYTWLEGVSVSVPTQNSITITPQGHKVKEHLDKFHKTATNVLGKLKSKDEYGKMKASGIASSIADVAGVLKDVPVIGSFAKATEMVANTASSVLSWFGFSKPLNLDDNDKVKLVNIGSMSTYNGKDTSYKLALDMKQELTVDPRIIGGEGEDEMALSHIFSRESIIAQFIWGYDSIHGTIIKTILVSPCITTVVAAPIGDEGVYGVAPSPLTYGSQPFAFWRGTIKYKIVIPSSPFIRGKLRIAYSPTVSDYSSSDDLTNITSNTILDLSVTTEIVIEVPWCQAKDWGQRKGSIFLTGAGTVMAGQTATKMEKNCNGMLIFQVIDPVVGPDTITNVDILVFMSGGDDFEVQQVNLSDIQSNFFSVVNINAIDPTITELFQYNTVTPQSEIILSDKHNITDSGLLYFGEKITSVRQILKRDYLMWMSDMILGNTKTSYSITMPLYITDFFSYFSTSSGYSSLMSDPDETSYLPSVQPNTPFLHYKMCYLAVRGGMRFKFHHNSSTVPFEQILGSSLDPLLFKDDVRSLVCTVGEKTTALNDDDDIFKVFADGATITTRTAPIIEAEVPFYSGFIYGMASAEGAFDFVDSSTITSSKVFAHGVENQRVYIQNRGQFAASSNSFKIFQSTAEDFSFMWFLIAPMHYEETSSTGVPLRFTDVGKMRVSA